MSHKPAALFVLGEFPGYAVTLAARMGERLKHAGVDVVYLCGSPHYEHFRKIDLGRIGRTYYASEFAREPANVRELPADFDRWWLHATFIRQRELVGKHLNAWESYAPLFHGVARVFDQNPAIAAVCSEFPTNSLIAFAFAHAQRRGIPFLGYQAGRVPGFFNIARDALGIDYVHNPDPPTPTPEWNAAPEYARLPMNTLAGQRFADLAWPVLKQLPRMRFRPSEHSPEMGVPLLWQARTTLRRFERKLRHAYLAKFHDVFGLGRLEPGRRNLLFPLHYRPEASTSVQARYFNDDIETLRNIAFSLPPDARLYVKEHPAAVGLRRLSFYRDIAALPATELCAPDWPLRERFSELSAIICLTSTVGFEALQAGIPVLLLGRVFYETYPGVLRIRSWDELGAALARVPLPGAAQPNPEILARYARTCFPGRFVYMSERCLESDNVEQLVQPLLRSVTTRAS